ncbi:MAG: hypothetical protein WAU39_17690 [Polyangiales bacterium]
MKHAHWAWPSAFVLLFLWGCGDSANANCEVRNIPGHAYGCTAALSSKCDLFVVCSYVCSEAGGDSKGAAFCDIDTATCVCPCHYCDE